MAYVKKILAPDEELIGIARLHWIYVIRGLFWFFVLAGSGWLLNMVTGVAASYLGGGAFSMALMKISNGIMFFMMAGGLAVFGLFVVKVLVTEIGMTNRRIMHKEGLLFVKVHQIDHEEVRGENLDLGYFGRVLGYGYIMLDCRFVGDIKLPAMENPERFLRALHNVRTKTQDALSIMVGKNAAVVPLSVKEGGEEKKDAPQKGKSASKEKAAHKEETAPDAPKPEIQPATAPDEVKPEPSKPEVPAQPTPHKPEEPAVPQEQPEQPSSPPEQPTPGPAPSQPPLQPPSGHIPVGVTLPSQVAGGRTAQQTLASNEKSEQPDQKEQAQPQAANAPQAAAPDPAAMAEMMKQLMPQMAEEVAKQLKKDGYVQKDEPEEHEKKVDTDLIASFGQASGEEDSHGMRHKVERALH